MSIDFSSIADDYFLNISLQTALPLPKNRETVLHFCEAIQRANPAMTSLYQRDSTTFTLEGDREGGSYPWVEIEAHRLSGGYFNPPSPAEAYAFQSWLLDRCIYFLGVSALDIEALDVLAGFNLDFRGNRDDIVARALLAGSPLGALAGDSLHAIEFEPNLTVALDAECGTQARLTIETRGSSYQVRTGQYDDEPISIYLTIRQYSRPGQLFDIPTTYEAGRESCEQYLQDIIVPQVIQPIAAAIAAH